MKNKKFWRWTNLAPETGQESETERVLELYGTIAEESWFDDDVTPQMFREELFAGNGPVTIWLNSPGGDCIAASQIYSMLMDYTGSVTVKIDGIAASAASVIAMAGTTVLMAPTALMMIHNPMTMAFGDSGEMQKAIDMLDEVKESIPLTLSEGSQVSFYHQDEEGKGWDVKYEMYLCNGRAYYEEVYLLKAQDRYYRYAGDTLEEIEESELSGAVFYEYGVKEVPSSSVLLTLSDFTLYKWKYGQSEKSYHADVVGTPHPQTITCYVDASHPSIAGIKTITAQYSGVIPLSYTLDDGVTYNDTTLQEFLNIDPAELYASLPESKQMTLVMTLQGDATITSFKITYIN